MSDETQKTVEELHREYSKACADAGHIQYAISVHESDIAMLKAQLEDLNKKRRDLNLTAASVQAKTKEEPKQ